MSKDLFGISNIVGDEDEDTSPGLPTVIVQTIPATGWRAAFVAPETPNGHKVAALACFALVEVLDPDVPAPVRVVRPMVAMPDGQVVDVEEVDNFGCLIPPGEELPVPPEVLAYVRTTMDTLAAASQQ